MGPKQTYAGELWCSDVLELLSGYVDGELHVAVRNRVDRHLEVCDWCARFGGEFQLVVRALRNQLLQPRAIDSELAGRIAGKIAEADKEST